MSLDDLRVRSAERLLITALDTLRSEPRSILTTSLGRGQLAFEFSERFPAATVRCWFLDLYPADETRDLLAEQGSEIEVVCAADLPDAECDLVAIPCSRGGESELTRDLLQQGFQRLSNGGTLLAAVDNPKDTWLHHEVEKLQKGLTRIPSRWGVAYRLVKKSPLKRVRDFSCEFAFRDGDNLV
ncbi:MAG: hypothetical protein KDA75_13960, partial [Planctomycetaceae bacterium]|nr:hypothetical protein [Planctomycetaceae bacterium]